MSDKLIFADGLESLTFDKNLVKMDFFSNHADSSSEDKNTQIKKNAGRLIIYVEDFVRLYNNLTELINELERRGMIINNKKTESTTNSAPIY